MAKTKKPKNLISGSSMKKHYTKAGAWKQDKPQEEGTYEDPTEYAQENPKYVFTSTEKPKGYINPKTGQPLKYRNKYVGIHDPQFAKELGASMYAAFKKGGAVVRIGEAKVK